MFFLSCIMFLLTFSFLREDRAWVGCAGNEKANPRFLQFAVRARAHSPLVIAIFDHRQSSCTAVIMFTFNPNSSLVDTKTEISVTRLSPLQKITLEAKLIGDQGELFESHAHYIADKDGKVDVFCDSSLGGSYSGVEPMGLLWSMKQAPGQRTGIRLMKRDVTKPYDITVNCFDGHVTPRETSLQAVSSGTFQKWYMANGVKRIPVREGRIRGTLFLPPGDGPFPGTVQTGKLLTVL